MRRVSDALAVAHRRGIVHRDIKPSNLFLPGDVIGDVKVLDFGIARVLADRSRLTMVGSALGTPGYMAPEQARGLATVDARADVFALGVVLFRCLAGRKPFIADDAVAVLLKIVLEDAPRLSSMDPATPAPLDELVAQMLAKSPDERPADAAALLFALDDLTGEIDATQSDPPNHEDVTREMGSVAPRESALTSEEQRALCVVLADTPVDGSGAASQEFTMTLGPSVPVLASMIERFGGRLDVLANGTLLVSISGTGSASDHAIAAARSALALRELLPDVPLAIAAGRGVAAGRVPVGEVIHRGVALLASAVRGAIRIDAEVGRLLDARFEVIDGPDGAILARERGADEPVRTLLGKQTSCVGRERDLAGLEMMLNAAAEEPGAATLVVTGTAGAGKSRLRYELLRRLAERAADGDGRAWEVWIGRGDPTSAGAPFEMIAQMVRRTADLREGEPLAVRHQKLRARVLRHVPEADARRVTEFLAELIGAPFPAGESIQLRAARQDPMLMGDQMRRAFLDLLAAECRVGPTLLVLEDLHWGDLPTVQLIHAALRALQDQPFAVLALARPDVLDLFPKLWADRGAQILPLRPLSPKGSERLVREVLGDELDDALVTRLVERASGNPFYLEELIRAVAEGKGESLPVTVLAMVEARLGALSSEDRRLLRAASVFGQVFWRGGVRALGGAALDVEARLTSLAEREVIARRAEGRFPGEQEYVFRHALLRDAAYATLTDTDRALGHRLAGAWLAAAGVSEAMVLAEHFERGGDVKRATTLFLGAAEQALQGNDIAAVIARAERGAQCGAVGEELGALRLLQAEALLWGGDNVGGLAGAREAMLLLPRGGERWCLAAGHAAAASGRIANHGELEALAEALLDLDRERTSANGLGAYAMACARTVMSLLVLGQRERAEPLFGALDRAAVALGMDEPLALAWIHRAGALRDYFAEDIGAYLNRSRAVAESFAAAGDVRVATLQWVNVGYGYMMVGAYRDAERTLREVAAAAERLGLQIIVANALHNWGMALCHLGALDEAKRIESAAVEACRAQGDRRLEGGSRMYLAAILERRGDHAGAEHEARAALELLTGIGPLRAQALATLSRVRLADGDAPAALAASAEAMVLLERGGAEAGEGLVRLAHIEALRATGDVPAAAAALAAARASLLARAANIRDEALRESFLRNVPENARTMGLTV